MHGSTNMNLVKEVHMESVEGEKFCINYLQYEVTEHGRMPYYGICLEKVVNNEKTEEVYVNLSENAQCASFIINYLAKHLVTPICAVEVIDYLYDLYFSA